MAAKNTGTRKKTNTKGKSGAGAEKKQTRSKQGQHNTRTRSDQGNRTRQESQINQAVVHEIVLIGTVAITVLATLSTFGILGSFGKAIGGFLFGLFGICAYVMPIAIFVGTWFLIANLSNTKIVIKTITAAFGIICFEALLELMLGKDSTSLGAIYTSNSKAPHLGGGIFGGLLSYPLAKYLSVYGALVVIFFLLIIVFVVISEKSFIGGVKSGGTRMVDAARNEHRRLMEESEEHQMAKARRKNQRMNRKANGIDTTRIVEPGAQDASMHEITGPKLDSENVYRGHVEIEEIPLHSIQRENSVSETATEPDYQEVEEVRQTQFTREVPVREVPVSRSIDYEPPEEEDGEPFTPKERIQVSEEAKAEMRRPPFSVPVPTTSQRVNTVDGGETELSTTSGKKKTETYLYKFPPISLLKKGSIQNVGRNTGKLSETAVKLQQILENFGVDATVTNESHGPSVTRYELQPEMGTKVSKITSLTDDIKLNLAAADIRIEAPIPGKAAVGIEVPNATRETVMLRDLIESEELKKHPSKIAFAAGMDISGNVIVADIGKMPHMLIAGTTGSGKSVFTNSIIMSILYRADPKEVRMIIVDPKVVEFGIYNGIPHLLIPVVTDARKAAGALNWAVAEMQKRYQMFADLNVRDLKGYNEKIMEMELPEGTERPEKLPQIVIIIDELADLMMVAAKEVEESICRLAQLARAAGIHLIIATQRPSVDVVTGLIKANIPSRVALLVSSGTDSRTIIDSVGAEKLLGNGDMMFYPAGYVKPVRLQGAFVSDAEVSSVVQYILDNTEKVEYNNEITTQMAQMPVAGQAAMVQETAPQDDRDAYFAEAGRFVIEKEKGSTSMLQRMFKIGFNRAARIMDQLTEAGVVGEEEGTKPRKVLMTLSEFEAYLENRNGGEQDEDRYPDSTGSEDVTD